MSYPYYRDVYRGEQVPEIAFAVWGLRAQERLSADTCRRSDAVLLEGLAIDPAGAPACASVQESANAAPLAPGARPASAEPGNLQANPCEVKQRWLGEQVRRCVCAMADILYRTDTYEKAGGALLRETVGGWSRSYAARDVHAVARELRAVQAVYLDRTGLLYRGR